MDATARSPDLCALEGMDRTSYRFFVSATTGDGRTHVGVPVEIFLDDESSGPEGDLYVFLRCWGHVDESYPQPDRNPEDPLFDFQLWERTPFTEECELTFRQMSGVPPDECLPWHVEAETDAEVAEPLTLSIDVGEPT